MVALQRAFLRVVVFCLGALALVIIGAPHPAAGEPVASYTVVVADRHGRPVRLHAEEMGHGQPIVLLHGLGGSSYVWRFVMPELARTNRVIAIDLKGFGLSEKPFDTAYGPLDHAHLVMGFLERRRLAGVTLVGHSFGGVVALVTGLRADTKAPGKIRRLVLFNTPAFPQKPSMGVAMLQQPVLPYVALHVVPPELQTAMALASEAIGMGHITSDDVKFYAAPLRAPGGIHALVETARQLESTGNEHIIRRYGSLGVATTVVACRRDMTVPLSTAYRLARTLPRARLTIIEGCDHIPPEQTPEKVVAIIRRAGH